MPMNPKAQRAFKTVVQPPPPDGVPVAESGPARLPSGRHGLPRRFVVKNQRERILDAVTRVVAREGYARATVGEVVFEARLSRRTFYEHFEDKETCFLAAYDAAVGRVAAVVGEAYRGPEDWVERVQAALEAFVGLMVDEPELARVCLVEVVVVGPAALKRRERAVRMFADGIRDLGTRQAPDDVVVPPLAAELVVGGLSEIVRARVLQGRVDALFEEFPQMVYCVLVPYCGHREASTVAERSVPARRLAG
jgi:AcrR family transcriptional regulator